MAKTYHYVTTCACGRVSTGRTTSDGLPLCACGQIHQHASPADTYEVRAPGCTAWQGGLDSLDDARDALAEAIDAGLSSATIYRVDADGERHEVSEDDV